MKKLFVFLALAMFVAAQLQAEEQDYDVQYFPGTTVKAPKWVFGEPVSGFEVTAVGTAEKTIAGLSFQKQMAITRARVELVQQVKTYVANMIEEYVGVSGKPTTVETVDAFSKSVTSNITEGNLAGSRVVKSIYGPDGAIWVLVAVDRPMVENVAKQALQTSMNNGVALYQEGRAKDAQSALIDAIARQRPATQPHPEVPLSVPQSTAPVATPASSN